MATFTLPSSSTFINFHFSAVGGGGGGGGNGNWITLTPTVPKPIEIVILKQQKVRRGNLEGYECMACQDFSPMAELNIPEGSLDCNAFKCYSCRHGLSLFVLRKKENEQ